MSTAEFWLEYDMRNKTSQAANKSSSPKGFSEGEFAAARQRLKDKMNGGTKSA